MNNLLTFKTIYVILDTMFKKIEIKNNTNLTKVK